MALLKVYKFDTFLEVKQFTDRNVLTSIKHATVSPENIRVYRLRSVYTYNRYNQISELAEFLLILNYIRNNYEEFYRRFDNNQQFFEYEYTCDHSISFRLIFNDNKY